MKKKEYIKPKTVIEIVQAQILAASGQEPQSPENVRQPWSLADYENGEELE